MQEDHIALQEMQIFWKHPVLAQRAKASKVLIAMNKFYTTTKRNIIEREKAYAPKKSNSNKKKTQMAPTPFFTGSRAPKLNLIAATAGGTATT